MAYGVEKHDNKDGETFLDSKLTQLGAVVVGGALVINEVFDAMGSIPIIPDIIPYKPQEWLDLETIVKAGVGVIAAKWGMNRLFNRPSR